jgi:hypothetical protein
MLSALIIAKSAPVGQRGKTKGGAHGVGDRIVAVEPGGTAKLV